MSSDWRNVAARGGGSSRPRGTVAVVLACAAFALAAFTIATRWPCPGDADQCGESDGVVFGGIGMAVALMLVARAMGNPHAAWGPPAVFLIALGLAAALEPVLPGPGVPYRGVSIVMGLGLGAVFAAFTVHRMRRGRTERDLLRHGTLGLAQVLSQKEPGITVGTAPYVHLLVQLTPLSGGVGTTADYSGVWNSPTPVYPGLVLPVLYDPDRPERMVLNLPANINRNHPEIRAAFDQAEAANRSARGEAMRPPSPDAPTMPPQWMPEGEGQ